MEGKKKLKLSQCKTVPKLEVQGFEHFYFLLSDCDHTGALLSEWQVEQTTRFFFLTETENPKQNLGPTSRQRRAVCSIETLVLLKKQKQKNTCSFTSLCIFTISGIVEGRNQFQKPWTFSPSKIKYSSTSYFENKGWRGGSKRRGSDTLRTKQVYFY